MDDFVVKDSGQRQEYASGMVRDVQDDKPMVRLIRSGPMFMRWAIHLTKGAVKYGRDNWTLADSADELERFKDSAARHFEQWLNGERDEDHAAAVFFNINAAEYVLDKIGAKTVFTEKEWLAYLDDTGHSVKVPEFGLDEDPEGEAELTWKLNAADRSRDHDGYPKWSYE